jgi:hypothetical protein
MENSFPDTKRLPKSYANMEGSSDISGATPLSHWTAYKLSRTLLILHVMSKSEQYPPHHFGETPSFLFSNRTTSISVFVTK